MTCHLHQDYPNRLVFNSSRVVHAAGKINSHINTLSTACGRNCWINNPRCSPPQNFKEVPNTTEITCKSCMASIGMLSESERQECMFVLMEKASKMFYNSGGSKHTLWTSDPMTATLYKSEDSAMGPGKRSFFYNGKGNEISAAEFFKTDYSIRNSEGYRSSFKFDTKRFVIKRAIVTLID